MVERPLHAFAHVVLAPWQTLLRQYRAVSHVVPSEHWHEYAWQVAACEHDPPEAVPPPVLPVEGGLEPRWSLHALEQVADSPWQTLLRQYRAVSQRVPSPHVHEKAGQLVDWLHERPLVPLVAGADPEGSSTPPQPSIDTITTAPMKPDRMRSSPEPGNGHLGSVGIGARN